MIYAARCGTFKFYAAWVGWSGTFTGWMVVRPAVEGIDSECGIGEVLGKPVFLGITMDLNGHMAVDRFVQGLKTVAWDLGVAKDRRASPPAIHPGPDFSA